MGPALRIHRDTLAVTLSGLAADETAILKKIFLTSSRPDRPGFDVPEPGVFSIYGSTPQLRRCIPRLASHPHIPERVRGVLASRLDNYLRSDYKIAVNGRVLDLGSRTHIMGILNVTPDSFSDGGLFAGADRAVEHALAMAAAGADIIDVGGESTRPGAEPLTEGEELKRIIPVIRGIARETPLPISVDTYKAAVARKALEAGASLVNDISGLRFSPDMARVAADHGAAVIIMHIKGTPRDMQANPRYGDVIGEITEYLEEGIGIALKAGLSRERVLIDPGIGFGKTLEHNLTILNRLGEFRSLGCPIVLGTSRKRFIGTVLGIPEPRERAEGTAATMALAVREGAHVLRVHDVAQMTKVARMADAIVKAP